MTNKRYWITPFSVIILAVTGLGLSACAFSEPGPPQFTPIIADEAMPTEEVAPTPVPTNATGTETLNPYPYTTPLPPPTPTTLDGTYVKSVPYIGTPVPCRRCAPYKAEGGEWVLKLEAGVFRVSHELTGFQGVGSFTVNGEEITLFNDPNCHEEVGLYRWRLNGGSLALEVVDDPCAFGLRAKNLATGPWVNWEDQVGQDNERCQPPSIEAAVTGHWPIPPECELNLQP